MGNEVRRLGLICGKGFERVGYGGDIGVIIEADQDDYHGRTTSAEELPVEHEASFGGARSVLYIRRWGPEHRANGTSRRNDYGKVDYGKIEGILRASSITDVVSTSTTVSYSRDISEGSLVVPEYFLIDSKAVEFDPVLRSLLLEAGNVRVLDTGSYIKYKGSKNRVRRKNVLVGSSVPREYELARRLGARYACLAVVTRNRKTGKDLEKSEITELTRVAADVMSGFVSKFTGRTVRQEKQ